MGSYPADQRLHIDSVCIIGAGASGLAAAKYLLAEKKFSRITIIEQRDTVGGIWNYVPSSATSSRDLTIPQTSPFTGHDIPIWENSNASNSVPSRETAKAAFVTPLYDLLETNIPRGLMGFSDLDWPEDCQLFPQHARVLAYLETYAEDVRHLIRFRTQVQDVRPRSDGRWTVKTQSVEQGAISEMSEQVFDGVVVANGHFNVPYIPSVTGLESWSKAYPGAVIHSKFYRRPEAYAGKKVVVVGNWASGVDIGAQIEATCAPPLLISQRSAAYLELNKVETRQDRPEIVEYMLEDRSVRFADGSIEANVDAVVYCTGYLYSFPFLADIDPPLITTGERVANLYQHMFYRPRPSLVFSVLNQKVIPFVMAESQAAAVARVFSGRLSLPSEQEMRAWEEGVIREMGDKKEFHVLRFPKDAEYINMLHDWATSVDAEAKEQIGKTPPKWDEKEHWTRERIADIKKAFSAFGEERHEKRSLESVGCDYEKWKEHKDCGNQV